MGEFIALLNKNFLVWRRNTCGCICEVATVVLFGILMAYISTLVTDTPNEKKSYLSETITVTPQIGSGVAITPADFAQHLGTTMATMKASFMKNCSRDLTKVPARQGENDKYGFVALGPAADPIVTELTTFFEEMEFRVQIFENAQEIDNYINKDDYAEMTDNGRDQICFGVLMEQDADNQYVYSVHYNVSQNPEFHDVLRLEEAQISQFVREDTGQFEKQTSSGLFYLINLIDNFILRQAVSTDTARIDAKLTKLPVDAYETSNVFVATNSGGLIVYSIDFPILIMFLRFIYAMLNEREKRIAQNLTNMGMSTLSYYFSWITTYFFLSIVYSTVYTLIVNFTLLPNVNFVMLWLLFFLTSMVFISFGVLIVGFFTKAKPGVLCGVILFIVFFGSEIALSSFDTLTVNEVRWFALSPVASLSKIAQGMAISQSFYQDYNFSLFSSDIENFKYSIFFWTAILQTIILILIGIYVDLVFPKETGVRKHPLFCFIGRKNKGLSKVEQDAAKEEAARADLYEEIDEALLAQKSNKESIEIENLRKVYPNGKVAVNNLNLSMFKNQIFALLGHNGAGKTTTISMMSGLLPTSSGSIKIMGYDALEDTEKIKTIMGVCPQTNPIYPKLTCGEHLELYAQVKKTKKNRQELNAEIDQILKDIDLFDKKNFPAGKMSGGQKRKLCVACAFIGGSRVILLDEPTSGLDVAARRHLWEMLKKYKEDKIIILTTHFMDEADFLGDRIGIMGDGKLLTCGSSLFLKNKFGSGYTLTLVKDKSDVSTEEITSVVKKFVQGAKMEDDISKELKFTLPNNEIEKFQDLFIELENNKAKYGIQSFGVSLATLEDVFLKVAKDLGHHKKEDGEGSKAKEILGEKELEMETVELEKIREKNSSKLFMMHFGALIKKRMIYFKRDLKGLVCEIILPIIVIFLGVMITLIQLIQDSGEGWINSSLFDNSPILTLNEQFSNINGQFPSANVTTDTLTATSLQAFDNALATNFNERRMFAAYFDEVDTANNIYDYTLLVNTTGGHAMNVGLNLVNDAILKLATGDSNAHIRVKFDPLILTANTRNFEGVVDGFLTVFLISLAFAFIPSSLIMFIVRERENNAKHQQIVSGVGLSAYWFSNYLVDYLKYFIVAVFTIIAFLVFDATAFIEDGAIGASIGLIFMFGFHIIAFSYLASFMFKGPSSAQVAIFLLSILTGFILMIVAFVCRVIDSTRDFSFNFLEFVWRLFPMFNICFGLFSLVSGRLWDGVFDLADVPGPWTRYTGLFEFIFMVLGTILCWALIFWIEMAKGKVKKDDFKPEEIEGSKAPVDQDVLKEEEEVRKNNDYAVKVQDVKKVFNVMADGGCCKCCTGGKVVSKKTAVKGITFGVRKGECFGLLGTNGAGKTTTFKMLSGEIQPTTGFAEVNGMSVATDMKKIRNLIGYCPQFDALLEKMTTREHLELYAAIKGIPKNMREKMIKDSIRNLNLTKYENVQAGTYSGGNKRKLSVAIALLGNPPVVFLDEPSSGMDPEARRFMWSVVGNISTKMKTSSVILTTHSMEEAEALSTKLAIMVEGKIECLGSVQALKSKYGQGFEIDTKINLPKKQEKDAIMSQIGITDLQTFLSMDDVTKGLQKVGKSELMSKITQKGEGNFIYNELKSKGKIVAGYLVDFIVIQGHAKRLTDFLIGEFGNVEILESYQSFFKFKVIDNVQLSQLFGTMQKNRDELNLAQYSVKQTSIEQIFIGFANKRVVVEE